MAEKRGYQPSPAEMQKAERMMTPEQKKMSALREQKLKELQASEATVEADIAAEQKREKLVGNLQALIGKAEARLELEYGQGEMLSDTFWEYNPATLNDAPERIYNNVKRQLEQGILRRRREGLSELYFNSLPKNQSSVYDKSYHSNLSTAINGEAIVKLACEYRAEGIEPRKETRYSFGFAHMADSPMWVVSTEHSRRSESNPDAYKPEDVVIVFTHPREAIREIKHYIAEVENGRVDNWPAGKVIFVDEFVQELGWPNMPGDPKKT